jgi:hypothetical protein
MRAQGGIPRLNVINTEPDTRFFSDSVLDFCHALTLNGHLGVLAKGRRAYAIIAGYSSRARALCLKKLGQLAQESVLRQERHARRKRRSIPACRRLPSVRSTRLVERDEARTVLGGP